MAYYGSTASSSVANPPRKVTEGIAGNAGTTGLTTTPSAPGAQGGALWMYCSTNQTTDVMGANFFTDGKKLGMRPGDIVLCSQFTSAGSEPVLLMGVIDGVSTDGASLSTGTQISSSATT